jgi:hypothetical protein
MYFCHMDFRVVPMIIVVFHLIFLLFINPDINEVVSLSMISNIPKMIGLSILFFALSIGSFVKHSFYSSSFKWFYWGLQALNVALLIYYIIAIKAQHV